MPYPLKEKGTGGKLQSIYKDRISVVSLPGLLVPENEKEYRRIETKREILLSGQELEIPNQKKKRVRQKERK